MKPGDRVAWDFHGFKGEGTLDRIDAANGGFARHYIRPSAQIKSSGYGWAGEMVWPFVVVMDDQIKEAR